MLKVTKVTYLRGYVLKVQFNNGSAREIDFADLIAAGGVYVKPLRSIAYFKKVRLDDMNYSICWPNGADFSPDTLYAMGKRIVPRKKASLKRTTIRKSRKKVKPS